MTVLMATNYMDVITDKEEEREKGQRPWHDAMPSPHSVDPRGGRRSASGHEWLMLLNAGTLAVGL